MAELASSCGVVPRTIQVGATAVVRGVRVSLDATGLATVSTDQVRGDFVTLIPGAAGDFISAASMSDGAAVPMLAGEASCDQGDLAYAFALGNGGVTSSGSVALIGRWKQTTASGKLGVVELFTAA